MKRASSGSVVQLGLLQHACTADPTANRKKTLALAERAAKQGAQIICTQELFTSQYFCQSEDYENFKLAETIPGPSTAAFQKLAKKYKVVIIASLFEKRTAGLYHNTAANGCYVAAVNRIGHEVIKGVGGDGIEFWGQSFVAGTSGEIISKASVNKEEILITPVDLAQVDQTRTHWPFLRDRRIDAYGDITKRLID